MWEKKIAEDFAGSLLSDNILLLSSAVEVYVQNYPRIRKRADKPRAASCNWTNLQQNQAELVKHAEQP